MGGATAASSGHLVHGMGTAWEAPTWPAIATGEAEAALAQFPGAGRLAAFSWHSPRPFSAAALVHTDQGAFFLKRHHHRLRSPAGLMEEHRFIAHLRDAGLPVPTVVPAGDGATAIAVADATYELHRTASGLDLYRDRPSWTPFLSLDHAFAAGEALARLHQASQGYAAPARRQQPLVASFSILPAADPLAVADAYVAARPEMAAFLADRPWRSQLARIFAAAGTGVAAVLADRPPLWTHNDWHPSNLLWSTAGTVETIFDFGLADRSCALHDLATAIERTAVRWLELGQGGDDRIGDAAAACALLAGYATVLPLAPADLTAIARLLPLVHVEFALSEVDYFTAVLAAPDDAALAWDGYLVGHADWFLSAPGQDLLRRIESGVAG
jgi:Ser/Thr protein kinase RdoA (MazF antagonist)